MFTFSLSETRKHSPDGGGVTTPLSHCNVVQFFELCQFLKTTVWYQMRTSNTIKQI